MFLSACLSGDKDEVRAMLASGIDIDATFTDGITALHQVFV
jgi:ankyrin repeat protein